jgi:IMP cyclohydrolase
MKTQSIDDFLDARRYPGRGLLVGASTDGPFALYWLTGRSQPSRERTAAVEAGCVVIRPLDAHAPMDDLRHYVAMRHASSGVLVGNGTHTDHISAAVDRGDSVELAMTDVEPEPDPPIHTPRIVGFVEAGRVVVASVRRAHDGASQREVLTVDDPRDVALALTTYCGDRAHVRVDGVPTRVLRRPASLEAVADTCWERLDPALRVLLVGWNESLGFTVLRTAGE